MGPEVEKKQSTDMILEASGKENGIDSKEVDCSHLNSASNCEDTSLVEQVRGSEDDEVDIIGFIDPADPVLVKSDWEDLTESSSSFETIISGAENHATMSDSECTSEYNVDASELAFNGFGDFGMRRKKPTPHWREFIQPHRRICKLIELKLQMLQSRARKYEKQMQDLNCQKQLQLPSVQLEDLGSKSLPFSWNTSRDKVVKRKKRRTTEDTMDITAYMSHHPLFSFFENRKSIADGSFPDSELGKTGICSDKMNADDELPQQPTDGHTSLEKILHKIGVLQSQVGDLKTRLDKVTSENARIFSSTDDLKSLLPCIIALPTSASSPVGGSRDVVAQLISEYNMGMPNGSRGEAMNAPHVVETADRSFLLDSITNPEDDILIYNQRMKEGMSNFDEFKIHPEEKPQASEHEQKGSPPAGLSDPDIPLDDQSAPKIRSISKLTAPKNKKKRRRGGSARRNY